MKNKPFSILAIFAFCFLLIPHAVLGGQIQKSFKLGAKQSMHFFVFVPKNSGTYIVSANGTGNAMVNVNRCGRAKYYASGTNYNTHTSNLKWLSKYKNGKGMGSPPPARQTGCEYGVLITCVTGVCEGNVTFAVPGIAAKDLVKDGSDADDGSDHGSDTDDGSDRGNFIAKPGKKKHFTIIGGDAGNQNSSAAKIPYNCSISGVLTKGDYDFFIFDYPGGTFRVYSEPGLNLVTDLIRASDGKVLAQSGVDTEQFLIEGDLSAGQYILAVRVMHHAGAGPYRVVLGTPGDCTVKETAEAR